MHEINGLTATVTAINTVSNDITVDIDSTGFTAFAFPLIAEGAFTPAHIVPITGNASEIGVTQDTGQIGMVIGSAICGADTNVMRFACDKSFSTNN